MGGSCLPTLRCVREKGTACGVSCGSQAGLGSLFPSHVSPRAPCTSLARQPAACPSKCALRSDESFGRWRASWILEGQRCERSGRPVIVFRPVGRLSADNKDEAAASPARLDI